MPGFRMIATIALITEKRVQKCIYLGDHGNHRNQNSPNGLCFSGHTTVHVQIMLITEFLFLQRLLVSFFLMTAVTTNYDLAIVEIM